MLAVQAALRAELEGNPVAFLDRGLEARLDGARARLAAFLRADPEDLTDPDPLQARLLATAAVEVPVHAWPRDPIPGERRRRLLRVSAHLYNDPGEYEHLAEALRALLAEESR